LADCDLCRGDADEMARLAGIARVVPAPRREVHVPRRASAAALVVAAAIIAVFGLRSAFFKAAVKPEGTQAQQRGPNSTSLGTSPDSAATLVYEFTLVPAR